MTNILINPCGTVPSWPRLLSIPCAAAYLSRSTGFVEARLRDGTFEYHIDGAQDRVIDREFLDRWIVQQQPATGKLREPKAATAARGA